MSATEKCTPTTGHVREDFAYPWEGYTQDRPARLEAFDRWKAENDRLVAAKALTDAAADRPEACCGPNCAVQKDWLIARAAAIATAESAPEQPEGEAR